MAYFSSFFSRLIGKTPADEPSTNLDILPALTDELAAPVKGDWLVAADRKSGVYRSGPKEITMTNGLISRRFRLLPNAATVGFDNLMTGSAILRGVKPEAMLELDGVKYALGGTCRPGRICVLAARMDRRAEGRSGRLSVYRLHGWSNQGTLCLETKTVFGRLALASAGRRP